MASKEEKEKYGIKKKIFCLSKDNSRKEKKKMSQKKAFVRLLVPANKAAPTPPVGPALGQRGIKAIDFCKQFNALTTQYTSSIPIPTRIIVNTDRSFTFKVTSPPTSWLLKQAACIEKGAAKPGNQVVATLSLKHIYEIAKIKANDEANEGATLRSVVRRIIGQTRSMGIAVVM